MNASLSSLFKGWPFALSMGPQRAATSWLDRYLRWRGDVCLPGAVKETYFFNRFFDKGGEFYAGHFRPMLSHHLMMEVTAQSFDCPDAPRRVREMMGRDVRLLCPLRHPVTRSYSLYWHYLRYGLVQGSLQEAVHQCPQILTSSHYADHLARWYEAFGADTISFVWQEELARAPTRFISKICSTLDLPFILPSEEIAPRCNVATASPHPVLARRAQHWAEWLRSHRFYAPINAAKALGLKRWVFGADQAGGGCVVPPDDAVWLREKLVGEMEKFEKLTGRSLPDCASVPHELSRAA